MAYTGKNYHEIGYGLEFFNYVSKLKNNGSLADIMLKQDPYVTELYLDIESAVPELDNHPVQSWLETKRFHIAETLNTENKKHLLQGN